MSKLDYEKNNTVTTLKNEIYGIEQIIQILETIKGLDFSKLENKIINVKIENLIKEKGIHARLSFDYGNNEKISFIIDNRYNQDTKSYVNFYDRYSFSLGYTVDEKGKHRLDKALTLANIQKDLDRLNEIFTSLTIELKNIDETIREYQELHNKMVEFKEKRTTFFKDSFKALNYFY